MFNMLTLLSYSSINMIKCLEINYQGKKKSLLTIVPRVSHQMCDIHTVLHREAATWEGQRRRRPEALPLGRPLISETTRGGGPAGWG